MTDPVPLYNMPLGIQGVVYVGVAGTTPTDLLNDEQKLSLNVDNKVVEWHTRGNRTDTSDTASQTITMSMTVVKNNMNDQFLLLQAAAQSKGKIALKALDRLTGGGFTGYGFDADWTVKSGKESQDDQGVDAIDFEFSLCKLYRDITWTNGAGS